MIQWLLNHPLLIAAIAMSLVLFVLMGVDKALSKTKKRRIRERTLMLVAVFLGAIGGYLGMVLFRHKTLHKKFSIGFPLLAILQIGIYYMVYFA